MKKIVFRMVVIATLAVASAIPGLCVSVSGAAAMVSVAPRAAGFYVEMPGDPSYRSEHVTLGGGQSVLQHYYAVSDGSCAYLVAYADMPSARDANQLINEVRDGQAEGFEGRVVAETSTSVNGMPGRKVRIEGGGVTAYTRIYVAGRRIYQVIFMVRNGQPIPAEANHFLNTFQITGGYKY